MKFLKLFVIIFTAFSIIISCKSKSKEITPELFIEIENKVLKTDHSPKAIEKVVEEYGLTLTQFRKYEEKVESDLKLKEKIGEIRLNMHKK